MHKMWFPSNNQLILALESHPEDAIHPRAHNSNRQVMLQGGFGDFKNCSSRRKELRVRESMNRRMVLRAEWKRGAFSKFLSPSFSSKFKIQIQFWVFLWKVGAR